MNYGMQNYYYFSCTYHTCTKLMIHDLRNKRTTQQHTAREKRSNGNNSTNNKSQHPQKTASLHQYSRNRQRSQALASQLELLRRSSGV